MTCIMARAAAGLATVACLLLPAAGHAFDVQPTVSVMTLPDDQSGITLTLRNPRTVALPVTFEIFERSVAEDGEEERRAADEEFLVFPPQAVVAPGATQGVRIKYVGAPPAESRSFTLYASEVPVDLEELDRSGVQTIFKIGASLHVAPARAKAAPRLLGARDTGNGVEITLANEGERFFYIDDLSMTFAGGRVVEGVALGEIAGRTLVPPKARRSFVVPGVEGSPEISYSQR